MFTKKPGRAYISGKTQYVDLVDTDEFSVHELDTMLTEIGYNDQVPMYYHFKIPDLDLDYGLKPLGNDEDVLQFLKYFPKCKLADVFIEHWRTTLKTYFTSPNAGKVIIEEIHEDASPELNKSRKSMFKGSSSSCKKKLYLEWNDQDHLDSGTKINLNDGVNVDETTVSEAEIYLNDGVSMMNVDETTVAEAEINLNVSMNVDETTGGEAEINLNDGGEAEINLNDGGEAE